MNINIDINLLKSIQRQLQKDKEITQGLLEKIETIKQRFDDESNDKADAEAITDVLNIDLEKEELEHNLIQDIERLVEITDEICFLKEDLTSLKQEENNASVDFGQDMNKISELEERFDYLKEEIESILKEFNNQINSFYDKYIDPIRNKLPVHEKFFNSVKDELDLIKTDVDQLKKLEKNSKIDSQQVVEKFSIFKKELNVLNNGLEALYQNSKKAIDDIKIQSDDENQKMKHAEDDIHNIKTELNRLHKNMMSTENKLANLLSQSHENESMLQKHNSFVQKNLEQFKKYMETNQEDYRLKIKQKQNNLRPEFNSFISQVPKIKNVFSMLKRRPIPKHGIIKNPMKLNTYLNKFLNGYKELMKKLDCKFEPINFEKLSQSIDNITEKELYNTIQKKAQQKFLEKNVWEIPDPVSFYYQTVNEMIHKALQEFEEQINSFVISDQTFITAINHFILNDLFFYIEDEDIYDLYKEHDPKKPVQKIGLTKKEIDRIKQKLCQLATIKEIKIETHRTMFNEDLHIKMGNDSILDIPDMAILKVLKKGYIIELTNTVIRKSTVMVNYNFSG